VPCDDCCCSCVPSANHKRGFPQLIDVRSRTTHAHACAPSFAASRLPPPRRRCTRQRPRRPLRRTHSTRHCPWSAGAITRRQRRSAYLRYLSDKHRLRQSRRNIDLRANLHISSRRSDCTHIALTAASSNASACVASSTKHTYRCEHQTRIRAHSHRIHRTRHTSPHFEHPAQHAATLQTHDYKRS
jgi:hypothetical protein